VLSRVQVNVPGRVPPDSAEQMARQRHTVRTAVAFPADPERSRVLCGEQPGFAVYRE